MRTIGVLTSGGDAPGMNACIRGVVRYGIYSGLKVIGIKNGYRGLIENNTYDMNLSSVADIIHRGGTILGTARCLEFKEEEGFNKAIQNIKYLGIEGLVVIGGDGSFHGAERLAEEGIPVVCIPGTIDNDLGYTEHTIGFFTAVETVLDSISKIRDTSSSHGNTNVIEVMGRNCGDLALYSGLAGGAEMVVVPELETSLEEICDKIMQGRIRGKKHSIIVLAEGAGDAREYSEKIAQATGIKTKYSVLGYIQRGGIPSSYDRLNGSRMGAKAVELLTGGVYNVAIGIRGEELFYMNINEALSTEKVFDFESYELTKILSI